MEWKDIFSDDDVEEIYAKIANSTRDMPLPFFDELLRAFDLTPFESVKIVILGQDPYHGFNKDNTTRIIPQANGLAFSVDKGFRLPPSLKNIYKELHSDLGLPISKTGNLQKWAEQGVLLLNTVLTVEAGKPGSHVGKGWESITTDVIDALTKRKDPVLFLLWGKKAEEAYMNAVDENVALYFLKAAHPSPFSANHGFFGCKHFSKANEWLIKRGKTPIDWSIDG